MGILGTKVPGNKLFFFSEVGGKDIMLMQSGNKRCDKNHPLDTSIVPDIVLETRLLGQSK